MRGTSGAGEFRTTRWSVVAAAGAGESASARDALETLCRAYWYPLYAYVRRRGHAAADAQDLVQGFFARFLEKRDVADADRERGRFRAFLLGALKHYLANEHDRASADKRGGGRAPLSLELGSAEGRFAVEPADDATPELAFDRHWASVLMERALERVRDDYLRSDRLELFERVARCLTGDREAPYARLAAELDLSEGAFKVAVHRARKRFREALRAEIADTLSDPGEVEAELSDLFAALGSA